MSSTRPASVSGQHDALVGALRPAAVELPESGIVRVMNHGRTREGLIPLWVGEGDLPTPPFIHEEAARSMAAGETFYTYQRGIPEVRQALADYHTRFYGARPFFDHERFFITGGGMQAIMIAVQALSGEGDEIVLPTPAWPNFAAAMQVLGAKPVEVPMQLGNAGWQLDLDQLFAACTPRTRALFVNSPANPTGWMASREELETILAFARERGLWIIADEVYGRFVYDMPLAPSFYDIATPDDRLIMINTFSKNWAMTGWRMGWMNVPLALGQVIENLIQYNTSGVAVFMQRAGVAALNEGEAFVAEQIARAAEGRRIVTAALSGAPRVRYTPPAGAFYAFFRVDGFDDTTELAFRLIDEAGVGLAPGTAFGAGGDGCLRLCFARSAVSLTTAMDRVASWLRAL